MKKLAFTGSAVTYLLWVSRVYAENITITPPKEGYSDISKFLTNVITLAFTIAVVLVLGMMIWGAIEWIISGGEEKSVKSARGKITNALIGLAVLGVTFAIAKLAGDFLGFSVTNLTVPTPK